MPTFCLDFEEWHELYLAAHAVPEEERRPCLQTAMLGLERVLSECTLANPETAQAILKDGAHACEVAECQEALDSAMSALASGTDPFEATATEDGGVEQKLASIEETVEAIARTLGGFAKQIVDQKEKSRA